MVVPAVAFVTAATSFRHLSSGLALPFGRKSPSDSGAVRRAVVVYNALGNLSAFLGMLAFLIASVIILQNLSDPANIATALSGALVVFVYGIVIKLLCSFARQRLNGRHSAY